MKYELEVSYRELPVENSVHDSLESAREHGRKRWENDQQRAKEGGNESDIEWMTISEIGGTQTWVATEENGQLLWNNDQSEDYED